MTCSAPILERNFLRVKNKHVLHMKENTHNGTQKQQELSQKLADLILDKVLAKINVRLTDTQRKEMESVFISGDDNQKMSAIKKYAPDFPELLKKESAAMVQKVKEKIDKKRNAK